MTNAGKCSRCASELAAESVAGLCPRCLVRMLRAGPEPDGGSEELNIPPPVSVAARSPELPIRTARLFGDFELIEELSQGGMGTVWRARQAGLKREVALKMILAGRFANDREVKRFRAEAEAVAQLDHPNIVPIYEVGEAEGQHYFAMKLMEGGSLADALGRRRRSAARPTSGDRDLQTPVPGSISGMAPQEAARLLRTVARAVHYAHERGILHRDLKPANILLDNHGVPHVGDFGLAKKLTKPSTPPTTLRPPTATGSVLGTPSYMPPEQASGQARQLTTAADIYSLGAILYELLVGRPPFSGASAIEVLRKVVEEPPAFPARTRGATRNQSSDLEVICLKCLEKDPARRYLSAAALAEDLDRFLAGDPIQARPVSSLQRLYYRCRKHPAQVAAWVAVTLALLIAGIALQWRREAAITDGSLRQTRERLVSQTLALVRASRERGQPGRRLENLPKLAAAAQIAPSEELRDEAIACLALFDLQDTSLQHRPPGRAAGIAFSPNLDTLAITRERDTLEIRRLEDGKIVHALTGWRGGAGWPRFSPGGDQLASRSATSIKVWRNPGPAEPILRVARNFAGGADNEFSFSPDGSRLALGISNGPLAQAVSVLELPSGRELNRWGPFTNDFMGRGLAFSPEGDRIAVLESRWLTVLNVTNGARLWSIPRDVVPGFPAGEAHSLTWHPRGDWILVADKNRMLTAWRLTPVPWLSVFGGHAEIPDQMHFGPGGEWFMSSSYAGETLVWDFHSMQPLMRLEGRFLARATSPDKKRVGYLRDPTGKTAAGVWNSAPSPIFREIFVGTESRWFGLSADGKWLATTSGSNSFRLYHTVDRRRRTDSWAAGIEARQVRVDGDAKAVFTQSTNGWYRWPLRDSEEWMDSAMQTIHGVVPSSVGKLLPQLGTPHPVQVKRVPPVRSAGRSFEGLSLQHSAPGNQAWSSPCIQTDKNPKRVAFGADGQLVAFTYSPTVVRLLQGASGKTLCDLTSPEPRPVRDLAFDAAGNTLAVLTTTGLVQIWDIARMRQELSQLHLDWSDKIPPTPVPSR